MAYTYKERLKIRENYKLWYPFSPKMIWFQECFLYENFVEFKPTPIELNFWNDIRCMWILLYPEFPVWNYFLDFADPIKKIWIEIDWEIYHLNKEKDIKRQKEIEKMWWKIYRFKWRDTFINLIEEEEKESENEYFKMLEFLWNKLTKISDISIIYPGKKEFKFEWINKILELEAKLKQDRLSWKITENEYIDKIIKLSITYENL